MSRINNALLKETPARKLTLVESIDGNQLDQTDYLVESKKKRVKTAVLALMVIAATVIGIKTLHSRKTKVEAQQTAKKTADFAERFRLSTQAFEKGDYDLALLGFNGLLEGHTPTGQNDATLLVNAGMVYNKKGDTEKAKKSYQAAIQVDPENSIAYNNLAMLAAGQKDWAGAQKLLEKAIAVGPDQTAPILNLAKIYEQTREWSLASTYYSKYLDHAKADPAVKKLIQKRIQKLHSLTEMETKEWEKQ